MFVPGPQTAVPSVIEWVCRREGHTQTGDCSIVSFDIGTPFPEDLRRFFGQIGIDDDPFVNVVSASAPS
jgi:hypothetical protein